MWACRRSVALSLVEKKTGLSVDVREKELFVQYTEAQSEL